MLYEQKFDGIRAIVIVEPAHPTRAGPAAVAQRQRQGGAVSRDRPRPARIGGAVVRHGDPRRRSRRPGRPGTADVLHGAAVPDAPEGRDGHRRPVGDRADGPGGVRPAARGARGSPSPAAGRTPRPAGVPAARAHQRAPAGRPLRRRRRQERPGTGATRGLGGTDRQGRGRAVPVGRALADMAEGQAAQASDAGDRRLDRPEGHAIRLRGPDGRDASPMRAASRRAPRRAATRRCATRATSAVASATPPSPICSCGCGRSPGPRRRSSMPRARADSTGSSRACSARCASASGLPRGDCVIRSSSGCVTTSAWRAWMDWYDHGRTSNAERRTPSRPQSAEARESRPCAWSGRLRADEPAAPAHHLSP